MPLPIVPADTRITNAYNKETFVFTHPVDGGATARFDVILQAGGSGGGNAVEHIHPNSDETFTVHYGRLIVSIDGVQHVVNAGQTMTVPKGARHFFRNAHEGETRATVAFSVAQRHLRFFLNLAIWTATEPRNFSREGDARLLPMALCLNAYPDHLYISGPPIWLQKTLFRILSPVARMLGHRLAVPPFPGAAINLERLVQPVEAA